MTQQDIPENEKLLRPGANHQFLVWLILLGVPALLLFLIIGKQQAGMTPLG